MCRPRVMRRQSSGRAYIIVLCWLFQHPQQLFVWVNSLHSSLVLSASIRTCRKGQISRTGCNDFGILPNVLTPPVVRVTCSEDSSLVVLSLSSKSSSSSSSKRENENKRGSKQIDKKDKNRRVAYPTNREKEPVSSKTSVRSEKGSQSRPSSKQIGSSKNHVEVVRRLKESAMKVTAMAMSSTSNLRRSETVDFMSKLSQTSSQSSQLSQSSQSSQSLVSSVSTVSESHSNKKIVSLRQVTAEIDRRLSGSTGSYFYNSNSNNNLLLAQTTMIGAKRSSIQNLRPPRDSMTAIVIHNDKTESKQQQQLQNQQLHVQHYLTKGSSSDTRQSLSAVTKHVAMVFSKPLMDDQITIESATRIHRLVRAMQPIQMDESDSHDNFNITVKSIASDKDDDNRNGDLGMTPYKPDLICFVGGRFGNNLLNDCDACYAYFRNECATSGIALHDTKFHLVPSYVQDGAIDKICDYIREQYVPQWLESGGESLPDKSKNTLYDHPKGNDQSKDHVELASNQYYRQQRCKLTIQFTLVSSEYHLCILNDIHARSPNRSPLKSLESSKWNTFNTMNTFNTINTFNTMNSLHTNNNNFQAQHQPSWTRHISIETFWTYLYATTATMPMEDPLQAFAGKCYKTAQELIPVVQNLRGVVGNSEFFQQENYRVLVAARRGLVSDMEELYQRQPSLQAVQRISTTVLPTSFRSPEGTLDDEANGRSSMSSASGKISASTMPSTPPRRLDIVLENALLSMGRCLDLVRPAGLLTGSVPLEDFKIALRILEQAVQQIIATCDPDQPLHQHQRPQLASNVRKSDESQ